MNNYPILVIFKMSKFIASSVNYSETDVLKSKYLSNILELYNRCILSSTKSLINKGQQYIIPNNNKKYYLLIVNKNDITPNNINSKYKICYFFPDHSNSSESLLDKNTMSDFYVEIDSNKTRFDKSIYLFEGYLYGDVSKHYLITDVLSIDNKIITVPYSVRFNIINQIFSTQNLSNLNGHLSINIHSVFDIDTNDVDIQSEQIFNMFKNNFVFKDEIIGLEYIKENTLTKVNKITKKNDNLETKRITKGKYIDVYNVFNIESNNFENILYVKSLEDSRKLRKLFESSEYIDVKCKFHDYFKKWYPLFE
jgi:hypothetical protein